MGYAAPEKRPNPGVAKRCDDSGRGFQHFAIGFEDDDMSEPMSWGGGVNPLSKSRFYGYAHGNHVPSPPKVHSPQAIRKLSSYPQYDFGQDNDEDKPRVNNARPAPVDEPLEVAETDLCFPLIGPVSPFVGPLSLKQVGCSTTLSEPSYIAWRAAVFLFALATVIFAAFEDYRYLGNVLGSAMLFTSASAFNLLRSAIKYKMHREDLQSVLTKKKAFGYVVFQIEERTSHSNRRLTAAICLYSMTLLLSGFPTDGMP